MSNCEIIIALSSGLIGSLLGGGIAAWGTLRSVRKSEFYRLRSQFNTALLSIDAKLSRDGVKLDDLIEDIAVDSLAISTIAISPDRIKGDLQAKWNKYRYDEKIPGFPSEYGGGRDNVKKLIKERLHDVISSLNN
jgi:hypothetical protein